VCLQFNARVTPSYPLKLLNVYHFTEFSSSPSPLPPPSPQVRHGLRERGGRARRRVCQPLGANAGGRGWRGVQPHCALRCAALRCAALRCAATCQRPGAHVKIRAMENNKIRASPAKERVRRARVSVCASASEAANARARARPVIERAAVVQGSSMLIYSTNKRAYERTRWMTDALGGVSEKNKKKNR